jgi:sulfur-oxidizing protein SoxX
MRKASALLVAGGMVGMLMTASVFAADPPKKEETGQDIAFNNRKGNCLACHSIPGDPKAITIANIAPPLIAMKARFPDKNKLREQVWDATKANPDTAMPPYGKHKILTDQELDKVVDYVYGL